MKTYYTDSIQRRFVEHRISKIQHRLQRKSIVQRIWHKLFPNRVSLIVTVAFLSIIVWLALGAPMP